MNTGVTAHSYLSMDLSAFERPGKCVQGGDVSAFQVNEVLAFTLAKCY